MAFTWSHLTVTHEASVFHDTLPGGRLGAVKERQKCLVVKQTDAEEENKNNSNMTKMMFENCMITRFRFQGGALEQSPGVSLAYCTSISKLKGNLKKEGISILLQ